MYADTLDPEIYYDIIARSPGASVKARYTRRLILTLYQGSMF